MPASYAHYRFGKEVLPLLPGDVRQCIRRFRRMYDLGLNGPDFLFYFYPFLKTATRAMGHEFHMQSGLEFFTHACSVATSEAARAYLYGLLGHYCLDRACHPYIDQLTQIGEVRHIPLESAFERHLLELDKHPSPHTFEMSKRMKPTRGECMTIAEFFPGASGGTVSVSFRSMGYYGKILANPAKAGLVKFFTKFFPTYPDHKIPEEIPEDQLLYLGELHSLYNEAVGEYPALLSQITAAMKEGTPLGGDFEKIFG